jgi:hypothetical protein
MCSSSTVKEPFSARVQFTLSVAIQESYGAKDFLQSISGKILARHDNDERESGAGYITATLVQFGDALDHGITPDRLGDGIGGDIAEYWEHLFDVETGRWKGAIQDAFEILGTDLLVIDCLEVYPRFRGQEIGLAAVGRTIDVFGPGCGLVACKPWPLQFTPAFTNNRRKLQRLLPPNTDLDNAVRKLRTYWSRAGFWPVGQTEIYALSMSQRR